MSWPVQIYLKDGPRPGHLVIDTGDGQLPPVFKVCKMNPERRDFNVKPPKVVLLTTGRYIWQHGHTYIWGGWNE